MKAVVIGAGINGVTSAIELRRRGHDVLLIDPGPVPHPLAASTDISKAVRAAYGPDEDYTALAERCTEAWRRWNEEFGQFYHETGFLFLRHEPMEPGDFEYESLILLEQHGRPVERITPAQLRERYPAWNARLYQDGFLDLHAGYAESGRVVATLLERAKALGVTVRGDASFAALDERSGRVRGIVLLQDRERIAADTVIATLGAWTPYLLPFTRDFFRATGHPVFHLKPSKPELFAAERFPVFGADISTTGFYGFPLNRDGVVKIANHGPGREMSPDLPGRVVTSKEEAELREFLSRTFTALANDPIVFTRVCMYCDTNDGDFWIAPDPDREGLVVAAGDCGHGFKFAPVLGEIIADAVEDRSNPLLQKFRWRPEVRAGEHKEAARFQTG